MIAAKARKDLKREQKITDPVNFISIEELAKTQPGRPPGR
jgi:hypothetical protein